MFRTRVQFEDAIQAAAAIAYHQPLTRDGLKDIFGKDISRDLIGRLHVQDLETTGPRSPRAGAPYTVIPPFLTGCGRRTHAAIFSFIAGVMPPMPMFGRSLL